MASMTIWIDADAVPQPVKEIIFRASERVGCAVLMVANRSLWVPKHLDWVKVIQVNQGSDIADRYIAEHAVLGDIVVTADILLAAAVVAKNIHAIDPRGDEYTAEGVGSRLSIRDFMEGLRSSGVYTGGPRPFGPRDKQNFAATLDRILTRARTSI